MSFITPTVIQPARKDIMLIGGCKPKMMSAYLGVLEQGLHMAGLTKSDVYITNIVHDRISTNGVWIDHSKPSKRCLGPQALQYIDQLMNLIEEIDPKVIVPMGCFPTYTLLKRPDYSEIRGYPFELNGRLVIPTNDPEDMIWSNYIWRYYLSNDLQRAKDFSDDKLKIINPKLIIPKTSIEAYGILVNLRIEGIPVSVDIEVSNYEVSCIAFSNQDHIAYSIPIDERWSEAEETMLWRAIANLLEDPMVPKIFQNGIFDIYFLIYKNLIYTKGALEDTMIAHSILYPDFLKSLGFLGGSYTTYTYWKDQADFKEALKKEA